MLVNTFLSLAMSEGGICMTPRRNTTTTSTEFNALPFLGAYECSSAIIGCRALVQQHEQAETAFE